VGWLGEESGTVRGEFPQFGPHFDSRAKIRAAGANRHDIAPTAISIPKLTTINPAI
jgi:hypothetical protein